MGKRKANQKETAKTICEIDLAGATGKQQFHDRVSASFACPAYYGRNLDAFYDVLTENAGEKEIVFVNCGEFSRALPGYYAALMELCEEACDECEGLIIRFIE